MTIAIQLLSTPNGAVTATIKDITGATVQGPIALTETPASSNFFVGNETALADGQYLVLFNDTDPDLIGIGCIVYEDGEEVEGIGTDCLQQFIDEGILEGTAGNYNFSTQAISKFKRPPVNQPWTSKEVRDQQDAMALVLKKLGEIEKTETKDVFTDDIQQLQRSLKAVQDTVNSLANQGRATPEEVQRLAQIPEEVNKLVQAALSGLEFEVDLTKMEDSIGDLKGKLEGLEKVENINKEDIKQELDALFTKEFIRKGNRVFSIKESLAEVLNSFRNR